MPPIVYIYQLGSPALPGVLTVHPAVHTCTSSILPGNKFFVKFIYSPQTLNSRLDTFPWFSRVPRSNLEANRSRGSLVMIGYINKQSVITTVYIKKLFKTDRFLDKTIYNILYRYPALCNNTLEDNINSSEYKLFINFCK